MLGVHRQRLTGRHPKEGGVKVRNAVHEATGASDARTRDVGIRVVQPGQIPAAIAREFGEHVATLRQHVPEIVGGVYPARVAARHGDDRDLIVARDTDRWSVADFLGDSGEFGADVAGQAVGCRVVEDQCR